MLRLPQELRSTCSKPRGRLYSGDLVRISDIKEISECKLLACVGDIVSLHALKSGIEPDIIIIDKKTRREFSECVWKDLRVFLKRYRTMSAFNPPGHLTADLTGKIFNAKKLVEDLHKKVMILVDGEEDLSVIPLVCILPENSLIIYGQPDEGVVALKVTHDEKILIHDILGKMEKVNGNGSEIYDICKVKIR
ncbi:MAG TPA: DUF359 domain-containing protein [Archaeoglobaceae archaeon]|nr:DUF359 domain-containing protein [Archaeoglobaceae archaeon]